MSTTPLRKFFDDHTGYLGKGEIEEMLASQYHPDAILITPFDVLDTPPPHVLGVGPPLVDFFRKWLAYHEGIQWESIYDFVELDDSISFQALMRSKAGHWVLGEAWHLKGDKIDRHYGFAHKLSD